MVECDFLLVGFAKVFLLAPQFTCSAHVSFRILMDRGEGKDKGRSVRELGRWRWAWKEAAKRRERACEVDEMKETKVGERMWNEVKGEKVEDKRIGKKK